MFRILQVGGSGAFIEPLNGNPLMRFYRRWFAPSIWRSITRYFDQEAIDELRQPFGSLCWKKFYLLSAGSFFWQYSRKDIQRLQKSLKRWMRLDKRCFKKWSGLEKYCWFVSMHVRKK